ncbi:MAG: universal stress protein, partial [Burkholderiales bacterium]
MFKHILIPTDGSPTATKAVKAGVALAKEIGAKVTGYCAVEPLQPFLYDDGYIFDRNMVADFDRKTRKAADKHVEVIGKAARAAGVEFVPVVTKAVTPYQGIV